MNGGKDTTMKITVTLNSREARIIENLVNRYAPLDGEAYHITSSKEEEFKWGAASLKKTGDNYIGNITMKTEFFADAIEAANEFAAPVISFFKLMKGSIAAYKAKMAKWNETEADILLKHAHHVLEKEAKSHTVFLAFVTREEDWVEVKPGIKKLMTVTSVRDIMDRNDIVRHAEKADKAGNAYVFVTYADSMGSVTDLDGAMNFFEDHKACW